MRVAALILLAGLWPGLRATAQTAAAAGAQGSAAASQAHPSAVPDSTPGSESATTSNLPAASPTNPRVQKLGHELMCMCGCNQILIECDHQGTDRCVMHDEEMAELERRVAGRESNSLILQSFVQEYGPQVLVVPPAKGFDLTAWLMPIFAALFGLSLAIIVVQRWRERALREAPVQAARPKARPDLIERARAETEDEDYN